VKMESGPQKKVVTCVLLALAICILLFSPLIQAQLADSPWPKFRGDLKNTGRFPYSGAKDNSVQWICELGGGGVGVIGPDGTIYLGRHAVSENGELKWSCDLPGRPVFGSPSLSGDGTLYFGLENYYENDEAPHGWSFKHYLCAINVNTGQVEWMFFVGEGTRHVYSPTLGPDGTIYFGSADNSLYAVNSDNTLKWKFETDGPVVGSPPAIDDNGTIYFGSWDDNFYALNPDGTLKWKFGTGGEIWAAPAIGDDGTIYFGTHGDNYLYALNSDGSMKWKFKADGWIEAPPTVGWDGTIYFGTDVLERENCTFYALNPEGTVKWSLPMEGSISPTVSPLVSTDDIVYFVIYNTLYAVNQDGTIGWTYTFDLTKSLQDSFCMGKDGTIYILSSDGLLAIGSPIKQPQPSNTLLIAAGATIAIIALLAVLFYIKRAQK